MSGHVVLFCLLVAMTVSGGQSESVLRGEEERRLTELREGEVWKKIYDHLFFGYVEDPAGGSPKTDTAQQAGPTFQDTLFTIARPGISIDPGMFEDAWDPVGNPNGTNMHTPEYMADMFGEMAPALDPIQKPLMGKISEFYERVVKAQLIHEPMDLTDEDRHIYNKAKARLYQNKTKKRVGANGDLEDFVVSAPSDQFQNYEDYQDAYLDARDEYFAAYNNMDLADPNQVQKWTLTSQSKMSRLQRAWDKFTTYGNKDIVERDVAVVAQFGASNIINEFREARFLLKQMQTPSKRYSARTFYPSYLQPLNFWDGSSGSWLTASFDTTKKSTHKESHFKKTMVGGGGLFSIFGGAGGGSHSTKVDTRHSTTDHFKVSFSYLRATIIRPWMKESLFTYGNWKLLSTPPGDFSTGKLNAAENPGKWPLLPKYAILAKDFSVEAKFSEEDEKTIEKHTKAGGGLGFGPFVIGGSYQQDDKTYDFKGTYKEGKLSGAADPQLIGFMNVLMPFMPPKDDRDAPAPAPTRQLSYSGPN